MKTFTSRRKFIENSAIGIFGLSTVSKISFQDYSQKNKDGLNHDFPKQDAAVIREVVSASHARFDVVKELVTARPELAKANWDWGFGDWESALGAASHMGRKDIAEFLIAHGARPNLYTFTMLGKLSSVKAIIEEMPGIQSIRGPHGITLLRHAKIRLNRDEFLGSDRKNVEAVIEYLESVGGADIGEPRQDISEEEQQVYVGKYRFGEKEDEVFNVTINRRGLLSIARGEEFGRSLNRVEEFGFAPAGAPAVRIRFDVVAGLALAVTVHDPEPLAKGIRVDS